MVATRSELTISLQRSLPAKYNVQAVELITTGQSSFCFQLTTEQGFLFAKQVAKAEANDELAIIASAACTKEAARLALGPEVIVADSNWLITKFHHAPTLADVRIKSRHKWQKMVKLLANFHQGQQSELISLVPSLSPMERVNKLLSSLENLPSHLCHLTPFAAQLCQQIADAPRQVDNVVCHGDANYGNLLVSTSDLLVDFDWAVYAPREYDLAMMISINVIDSNELENIIAFYHQCIGGSTQLSIVLVTRYVELANLINGLWYIMRFQQIGGKSFYQNGLSLLEAIKN